MRRRYEFTGGIGMMGVYRAPHKLFPFQPASFYLNDTVLRSKSAPSASQYCLSMSFSVSLCLRLSLSVYPCLPHSLSLSLDSVSPYSH